MDLDDAALAGTGIVQIACPQEMTQLPELNRAQRPSLLGVTPTGSRPVHVQADRHKTQDTGLRTHDTGRMGHA